MKLGQHDILICNCERTMALDGKRIARALGLKEPADIASHLCRADAARFTAALEGDAPLLVACTQEAPLFEELAQERGRERPLAFTNIRERAGWTTAKGDLTPKIAALIAEALVDVEPTGSLTVTSDGQCLVYGKGQAALDAARRLQGRLSVTLLLSDAEDLIPPSLVDVPIYRGRIAKAAGRFGGFEVTVDGYAPAVPSSRASLEFAMPRDGARATCSLILDLSGETPLFPGADRREGYVRADPGDPAGVARALFDISDMVGEFEKPLYVHYDPDLCAHSRNRKTGCTRCLDVCPAAAITPDGDHVRIDPIICGGCGACSAVCPTGAASYRLPERRDLVRRIRALLSAYLKAGGGTPQLLVHDERHGGELISLSARFGRGLPLEVLPLAVNEVTQLGHEAMLAALAGGASRIVLLADPRKAGELTGTAAEAGLVNSVMEGLGFGTTPFVEIAVENDPDGLDRVLWDGPKLLPLAAREFEPTGLKRDVARTVLSLLHDAAPRPADVVELPSGAPYGRILVDRDKCTLCLACVSACPRSAILDDPDKPLLKFVEAACVQCGLCRVTCPESAITLEARYDFTPAALSAVVLNEEKPFHCIRCGKPFGTAASVKRIQEKLAGKHSMFLSGEAQQLIQMCDNCRIVHQAETETNPLAVAPRPKIRTTEDYLEAERRLKEARAAGRAGLSVEDFMIDE